MKLHCRTEVVAFLLSVGPSLKGSMEALVRQTYRLIYIRIVELHCGEPRLIVFGVYGLPGSVLPGREPGSSYRSIYRPLSHIP
jgi:hypothetical protein